MQRLQQSVRARSTGDGQAVLGGATRPGPRAYSPLRTAVGSTRQRGVQGAAYRTRGLPYGARSCTPRNAQCAAGAPIAWCPAAPYLAVYPWPTRCTRPLIALVVRLRRSIINAECKALGTAHAPRLAAAGTRLYMFRRLDVQTFQRSDVQPRTGCPGPWRPARKRSAPSGWRGPRSATRGCSPRTLQR